MNVVFAGYRKWSFSIFKKLIEENNLDWKITGVITSATPEEDFTALKVPTFIYTPDGEIKEMLDFLSKQKAEICLFYGWSWIIPQEIYKKYLSLILHPSALPKYRGGSPLQHQIMAGEKESAVTILEVGEKIDAGDIYSQTSFSLDGSLDEIFERIKTLGIKDTKRVLDLLAKKAITPIKQDNYKATVYKRRKPEESEITPEDLKRKNTTQLYNFVRALADPYPNAFIKCNDGKKLLIKTVEIAK